MNRLFLDYDTGKGWLWRSEDPLWDDLLELIRMEAVRLSQIYPLGDIAVIMRSDNGWFIKFPKARLTREQEESIMWQSKSHFGHKAFSGLVQDTTLRVSEKPWGNSHPPYLVEIIKLETD